MQDSVRHLFVYGSLRKPIGHDRHQFLDRFAEYIGEAVFQGKLYMVRNYPGAVVSESSRDRVAGELYRLKQPEKVFPKLDFYEGYDATNRNDSLFIRSMVEVRLIDSGESVESWIYLYNKPVRHLVRISSGDYLEYLADDHS